MSPPSPPLTLLTLFLFLLCLTTSTTAIHASEAGVIDWHKQFIGVPLKGTAGPVFHRVNATVTKSGVFEFEVSERTVVVTGTAKNLLAALDPATGDVRKCYISLASGYWLFVLEELTFDALQSGGISLRMRIR